MDKKDYTNQKIDHVRVLEYAGKSKDYHMWRCVCDCGKEVILPSYRLTAKRVSCGCQRDNVAEFFICRGCGKEMPNTNGAHYRIWCDECLQIEKKKKQREYQAARRAYRPAKKEDTKPKKRKSGVFSGMTDAQIADLAHKNRMKVQTYVAWCEGTGRILYPPTDEGRHVDWQADPRFV